MCLYSLFGWVVLQTCPAFPPAFPESLDCIGEGGFNLSSSRLSDLLTCSVLPGLELPITCYSISSALQIAEM